MAAGADVIANDLSAAHLEELARRTPDAHRGRLELLPGRFPRDVALPAAALDGIHASNVLHFLTGAQLATAARQFHRWLAPGGRLFINAATPYRQPFTAFIQDYEMRYAAGIEWPGWVENTRAVSRHRLLGQLPRSIHLLESRVLRRVFGPIGFEIDELREYRPANLSKTIWFEGSECVALVATKR